MMTLFWHNYFASAYSKVFTRKLCFNKTIFLELIAWVIFKDLNLTSYFGPAMMILARYSNSKKKRQMKILLEN
ncbi:MAG: hypothetical protein CM15mP4_1460 [Candidatus Neomarinimicrobiota bacterium]|nr:MAG: hypothetical protein CM15mP4_1460 [Candidatus Neomarinimicrobiota bacterium]